MRAKRMRLGPEVRNFHFRFFWLEYALSRQEGRKRWKAHAVLADVTRSNGRGVAMNLAIYALATGKPDEALCHGDFSKPPLLNAVAVLNVCGLMDRSAVVGRTMLAAPCK